MSFTKSLESMDLATITAFEASQMAILKAIRKAKKSKMEESGVAPKSNVWVSWTKQVKSLFSDEYETEAEKFKAENGKLFGFLGKFAKKMKETHSDDYESFKTEHSAASSKASSEDEEEKPKSKKAAPKKSKKTEESEEEKPKKTRAKKTKKSDESEEEKPKKRGRPAKKAVEEVASDDE